MLSGTGNASRIAPAENCTPVMPAGSPAGRLLAVGPILVLAFVAEGLFNHLRHPFRLGFLPHMVLTAVFLGVMGVYWVVLRDRARPQGLKGVCTVSIILMAWGFASCLAQDKVIENTAFWAMWSASIFAGWWAVPCLLRGLDLETRVRLLMTVLFACVLLAMPGILAPSTRLIGLFGTATTAGRLLALAVILCVARWLSVQRLPSWLPYATLIATVLLIMTRTRASIAAAILGSGFVLWNAAFGRDRTGQIKPQRAIALLCLLVLGLAFVLLSGVFSQEELARHFRVEGGIERVYAARSMNWSQSWVEFPSYGLFGKGYLSKFGTTQSIVTVFGLEFPRYEWATAADPLNMLLLTSKQIGLVGGLLLAGLLVCLVAAVRRLRGTARAIAGGWLAAGLIFGLLDGNWLVSFGDPVDRLSLVALSAMLAMPGGGAGYRRGQFPHGAS